MRFKDGRLRDCQWVTMHHKGTTKLIHGNRHNNQDSITILAMGWGATKLSATTTRTAVSTNTQYNKGDHDDLPY